MPDPVQNLHIHWQTDLSVLSLRGEGTAIAQGVERALGLALPSSTNTTHQQGDIRLVWVSPDDCFVIAPSAQAAKLEAALREALQAQHFAVTDVSSGYFLLSLAGAGARSMLAQGCPLDLHPKNFALGQCAGSHFFKASVWLWPASDSTAEPKFELLIRRSFASYVDTMINKASLECKVERSGQEIEAYA
ncbi:sarcosine oxidase subunit gamma family protein [Variovorax sp. PCZ-1]|uniref:sarcosine oxidase subunit gamma n=1 Tax=Variovorax sp. PCZ-1 TaxID=2835533 RepID=UPI001BD1922A|nr:sarcosine oxidase subunit gamma family protein [Variovorax sp. PCZ-1]MBS7807900.1 sarcosine oxidase subunit gamma [Variovorax sp. PCZ-1]